MLRCPSVHLVCPCVICLKGLLESFAPFSLDLREASAWRLFPALPSFSMVVTPLPHSSPPSEPPTTFLLFWDLSPVSLSFLRMFPPEGIVTWSQGWRANEAGLTLWVCNKGWKVAVVLWGKATLLSTLFFITYFRTPAVLVHWNLFLKSVLSYLSRLCPGVHHSLCVQVLAG